MTPKPSAPNPAISTGTAANWVSADHTVPSEDFVLQKFSTEEETTVTTMVTRATETLDAIFTHGLDRAMTEYNRIVSG